MHNKKLWTSKSKKKYQ